MKTSVPVLSVVSVALAGLSLGVATARADQEKREFDSSGIHSVRIVNRAGKVKISGIASGKTAVTVEKRDFGKECKLTIEKEGAAVVARIEKEGLMGDGCQADLELKVPSSAQLDIENGSGSIEIQQVKGAVKIRQGSGSLSAEGMAGAAQVQTGSGGIKLSYSQLPVSGDLSIETGSGDAEVTLPKGAQAEIDFKAGHGKLRNEVGDTPGAKFRITAKAGSGNLTVKKAGT